MRRVAFLWLPHWPIDRLQRGEPHEAGPLVVSRSEGPRLVVAAACPAATRLGLHAGMKLAQAQAMVPGLRALAEQAQADQDALAGLAAWCLRYTPHTSALPPDGIWLDLTGCAPLHGGEQALLSDLSARLSRAGLAARIALAATPGAAYALAHHAGTTLTIAADGASEAMLSPLPVRALRLDKAQVALLQRLGLNRIGDLAALPRAPLARRLRVPGLGASVTLRLDQAFGRVREPIEPVLPETPIDERLGFAEPLLTAEALSAATARLAFRLCRRLQARCRGARRLELVFQRIDNSRQAQPIALAAPSHEPRHIARLFDERREQVDPGEGIEAMILTATLSEALHSRQKPLALLDAASGQAASGQAASGHASGGLAPLIDRLGNRLGPGRLWRPWPVQSDVPERAVRAMPPLDALPSDWLVAWPAAWPAALPRPIRLFDPPMPVRAMTVLPDAPPSFFVWRNHHHRIRRADGPERIAGEWWRRPGEFQAMRDYFRLEDETGRRFWLFRRGDGANAATGDLRWFLHGLL